MKLYDYPPSGNCYKIRLLLAQLGIAYERVHLDMPAGAVRTPEFRARNPIGRVPALELDDGTVLGESNAILWYLAEDTRFAPRDRLERARTLQWMFFEQYDHEPNVAVVRAWLAYFGVPAGREAEVPLRTERGHAALAVMDRHLGQHAFFVGERYGLADVALYAYTHASGEGGFDLAGYPALTDWLARVAAQPGHIRMDARV